MTREFSSSLLVKINYCQEIVRSPNWKTVIESEDIDLHIYRQSKFLADYPIIRATIRFSGYISLSQIFDAFSSFSKRRKWDTNLKMYEKFDVNNNFYHSVYEYSIYKAEFYEEKEIGLFLNSVVISFESLDRIYGQTEGTVLAHNCFSLYFIKEIQKKTEMSIFIHIDPKTELALLSKEVVYKKTKAWCESLKSHLENPTSEQSSSTKSI
jgi:hypothetical protein